MPSAAAAPCPDVEVVFARGTTEAPGAGPVGDAFVTGLRAQVGAKSVESYGVDYPATIDFRTAMDGIFDARDHILATAANCPDTKMVLGGFSQGAAVIGFVTAEVVPDGVTAAEVPTPMPADIAEHVAAVALFGKPSTRFMSAINDPTVTIGPQYASKTVELCVENDLVCDPHGSSFAVHNQYIELGMVDQGVTYAANLLKAGWAADGDEPPAAVVAPLTPPAPVQAVAPAPVPVTNDLAAAAPHLPEMGVAPGPAVPTPTPEPSAPLA